MNNDREIHSDTLLDNIDQHFRVLAGPGAGKTYWLVKNVQHVVRTSSRLSAVSRVACISYTNTAVNELVSRLGTDANRVDISTIHSFLYRNVVKPYLHLLKDEQGEPLVNFAAVNGHDEHYPSEGKVRGWLTANKDTKIFGLPDSYAKLLKTLKQLTWVRSDDGSWILEPLFKDELGPFLTKICKCSKLIKYKQLYWPYGTIDHDDVLYFAYRILEEHPFVQEFLSAKFRYLFIDEFQDTLPTQAKMVEWLSRHGTVVGVIGDPEQAIFGFLRTTPEHFHDFSLPGHIKYHISDNRRSTGRIVAILNRIRADGLQQAALRDEEGEPPCVYVGELEKVIPAVRASLPEPSAPWFLARSNKNVINIRRLGIPSDVGDPWEAFAAADSGYRAPFIRAVVRSAQVAKAQDFVQAFQVLLQAIGRRGSFRDPLKFPEKVTDVAIRGVTLSMLEHILNHYETLAGDTLIAAYESISDMLETILPGLKLSKITRGNIKKFAEKTPFQLLLSTITLNTDETRNIRSIHQAKGAETENVCVYLADAVQVSHLFPPADTDDEKRRITYVALSRARNRLVVCMAAKHADEARLANLGFQVNTVP